ncbi:ABR233Wp [Eremothecium gossypii ATCC 10895]|uniref:Ubiquitin thioesterase OTU n=1 Tax=Eremothecium gossypii (strain ATCC 10895 / CBS 109.51 / FGSC 9923 / NRRL Y-1056) TaxID=284811 RepID=Q75CY9_EREGS|nr:ABR233Wp [Eremothecium gossypii ATCC 10895]AAS51006.2 ABR233Wp [Eremothecium gossypii ATCC 10895]AEY95295.1 FABR233Wp [Eremothecium gossypii FDAG1]
MKIKVTVSSFGEQVLEVGADASLNELLTLVKEAYGGEVPLKSMRFGYPPQQVELCGHDGKEELGELGISGGERIVFACESGGLDARESRIPPNLDGALSPPNKITMQPGMTLEIHEVPDDNSCLFHAISYALYKDTATSQQLREVVAREVEADPVAYSDSIVGRPNREYAAWIRKRDSWGGAIEIAILSKYLATAMFVLDIDAGRYEKFNEDKYNEFIVLVFSGIHYDTLQLSIAGAAVPQTVFDSSEPDSDVLLVRASEVASKMKKAGLSFNTYRERIRCNQCGTVLLGDREVSQHAKQTGHIDFGQVSAYQ